MLKVEFPEITIKQVVQGIVDDYSSQSAETLKT